ncbi:hypothetical protein BU23DRAFT_554997 [Bimuria novae-zelandiae CBS 107.79]|uniref:DUF202 domain-containing protein n=1 Tax=Bimuria novae-zelandiae CBS 107.79 TaxID=1447943 RepID=A0A6A5V6Z5_9PLEO|nr:hypothetical protein BU23DRAFT_554997 [Bimuria novae-zelandiae CBS 107.79]
MDSLDPSRVTAHDPDVARVPSASTPQFSRTFTVRRSISFDADAPTRKRNPTHDADSAPNMPTPASADESAPIMRTAQGQKDYNSISPRLSARSTGAESRTAQEGTHGAVQRGTPQSRTAQAEREAADVERREGTRWAVFWEKYGSVELENKGSVARDHLALERTFLAWLRTSLSFASIGIAITQLFRLNTSLHPPSSSPQSPSNPSFYQNPPTLSSSSSVGITHLRHVGKPLGATFIAISLLILLIGFHRYFEAQHYVIRGKFPASRGSVIAVSVVAGGLIVCSLVVILAVAPGAWEK